MATTIQSMDELVSKVEAFAKEYMSKFDGSHDFAHVQRVVSIALHIANAELRQNTSLTYNINLIHISALLHDVNDRKYKTKDSPSLTTHLERLGCVDPDFSAAVEDIVTHISFNQETSNPSMVQEALLRHPELGVVQDADRIDAVGAIGLGRLFTYGGAKDRSLDLSIEHLDERLIITGDRMKTKTGKDIIKERIERIMTFRGWWSEEMGKINDNGAAV